jgi:hypothetical protein
MRRYQSNPTAPDMVPSAPEIRLLFLPDAADPDGLPRPALLLQGERPSALPVLRAFPNIAAALDAKRSMEARR